MSREGNDSQESHDDEEGPMRNQATSSKACPNVFSPDTSGNDVRSKCHATLSVARNKPWAESTRLTTVADIEETVLIPGQSKQNNREHQSSQFLLLLVQA